MKEQDHSVIVKKVDRVSSTEVLLSLEFEGPAIRREEERTVQRICQSASLPGFRPGKAPLNMVRSKYREQIKKDMLSNLLEKGLVEALEQTKLVPINQPQVKFEGAPVLNGESFGFEARFEVQPEIELRHYKGIPLKAIDAIVTDVEVDEALQNIRERMATMEPTDAEKAEKGLYGVVEIGYELLEEPKTREERKAALIELGAERLLPELEAAFLEMKPGEERRVTAKFPDSFGNKELAGKEAAFDCKLSELKKKVLPELSDALAGNLKEGATLEDLRAEIRANMLSARQAENRRAQRNEILDYLLSHHSFEVPASMVERQARSIIRWIYDDMRKRGVENPPDLKEEELREVKRRAETTVRSSMILREIATKENIAVDEGRVRQKADTVVAQLKRSSEEAHQMLEQNGILDQFRDEVLTDQVFEFLIENGQTVGSSPRGKG